MQKLNELYRCDSKSTRINSLNYDSDRQLVPFAILHHDPEIDEDWFHIPNIGSDDPIDISIYEPKYMDEKHGSLSEKDKKILMDIFNNGGWEKLRKAFNIGCEEMCDEDAETCEACLRRRNNFPATPPDYTQLPD